MPIGETLDDDTTPKYYRHPPAGTFWWKDGDAVDAGSAMLAHSNLSVLSLRNLRTIWQQPGPGRILGYDWGSGKSSYDGVVDATSPAAPIGDIRHIAWTQPETALTSGPTTATCSALLLDPPGYRIRSVHCEVRGTKGTRGGGMDQLYIYFAVTATDAPPSITPPLAYMTQGPYTSAGDFTATLVPVLNTTPVRPNRRWICRADGSDGETALLVPELWYWVGWDSSNDTGTVANRDAIWSIAVYESGP